MMGIHPVILWTDALVWLLVAGFAFALARRDSGLRKGVARLTRAPVAVASGMVLVAYLGVTLLDSLHFHPAAGDSGVVSVFDLLLRPLQRVSEKTYSAPLADRLFVQEQVLRPDGHQQRVYPLLAIVAQQAHGHAQPAAAVWYGVLQGLGLAGASAASLLIWFRRRRAARAALPPLAWRTALVMWTVGCVLFAVTVQLAASWHVFGTDKVGQDVLYQSLKSIRTDFLFGLLTTLATLPLAVGLGVAAGYFGGWIDDIIQYVYTTLNAIPGILLIAAAVLLMQGYIEVHAAHFDSLALRADFRLLFLCAILGVTSWTGLCRLLRAETLKLRELEYVQAARSFGVSDWRIMWRHILPNLTHLVLISVVMDFSSLVLVEAVLSYLGLGVDPSVPSWGNMINAAQLELAREPVVWWPLTAAFSLMFVLVLSANLFADSVREAFDPLGSRS